MPCPVPQASPLDWESDTNILMCRAGKAAEDMLQIQCLGCILGIWNDSQESKNGWNDLSRWKIARCAEPYKTSLSCMRRKLLSLLVPEQSTFTEIRKYSLESSEKLAIFCKELFTGILGTVFHVSSSVSTDLVVQTASLIFSKHVLEWD